MGRWQPYLYNAQRSSAYDVPDVWNPKAVTQASRQPPSPKKEKPEGPLIDFNKHPDSYLVLPYGKRDVKPLSPKVKDLIKIARWIQLGLRVLCLCGAIGALLCGIFIRGAQTTEGYIIRIPPGIDIVNTLYAIYHLLRSAKARAPRSSASYHFFALVMDAGFIPFYVFTALLAKRNYNVKPGTDGRWRTFFPTNEEADKVLETAWLNATTVAGLHIASIFIGLYLVLVFRKITKLPPDMNPLEDNLTSRRKTKHKHKNSSISAMTPLTAEEKRASVQSGNRISQADSLMSESNIPLPDVSKMAFMHTRTNSNMTYSPHTPNSARQSRHSLYSQPASNRQSRADLHTRDDLHRRDDSDDNETLAQRKSVLAQQAIKRSSRPHSFVSSKQEYYTPPSTAEKKGTSGDLGDVSLQDRRGSLQSDNWFVYGESDSIEPEPKKSPKKPLFISTNQAQGYNAVSMQEDSDDDDDELSPPMMPQPLRMNPPTPPPAKTFGTQERSTPPPAKLQRTHTTTSISSEATFSRSPTRASTPKSRYYGDLKAATQGIRNGGNSPAQSPNASPTKSKAGPNNLPSSAKQYATNSPSTQNYTSNTSPFILDKKSYASVRRTGETAYTPVQAHSPRVVSRTGVDYEFYDHDGDADLGSGRRRDVSGKIAEEGRGGLGNPGARWGGGLTYRKVSGMA